MQAGGQITSACGGSVWRIAPPLTVTREEIDQAVEILDAALTDGMNELSKRRN